MNNFQKTSEIYKTQAIVLAATHLGEQDILLTLYTKGYGKISARAISACKKESKLKGYLRPFTHVRFLLAKSRTIDIVTDVELINNYNFLHGNLTALAYAYYFAELVDKLVVGSEPDDNIWRLVARAFEVLDEHAQYCHSEAERSRGRRISPPWAGRGQAERSFAESIPHRNKVSDAGLRMTDKEKEVRENINLSKIKTLFEQKLLEFLGYGQQTKTAPRFIWELFGEEIKSEKFLRMVA